MITFPNPPFPKNISSSKSLLTRDFPATPVKKQKSGIGSCGSGLQARAWTPLDDAASAPSTDWLAEFDTEAGIGGLMKACCNSWKAAQRSLSSGFKQLGNKGEPTQHSNSVERH